MLDEQVRAVLERLEREDARRARRRPAAGGSRRGRRADDRPLPLRARRAAGRLRGARDRRLARLLDHLARRRRAQPRRPRGLARDRIRAKVDSMAARTSPKPGSRSGPSSSRATPSRRSPARRTCSTSSSSTPRRTTTRQLFALARPKLEPGGRSSSPTTSSPTPTRSRCTARPRQADPTLVSVTVPLDRGLELSVVLASGRVRYRAYTAERRWSGSDFIKYGQWRYQRVEA